MSKSYTKKIILIYFFKTLGIATGFLSLLMVVPRLTSNTEIYGIYTVCISLNLFFSYADLGFLGAGQKYAAEYFGQKDLEKEMQVLGFVLFFLAALMAIFISILLIIAYQPSILIKSNDNNSLEISSKLILILALSSPIVVLQRFNQLVYSIRIEDYISQSIDIIANLLKILSIQFFVTQTSYNIVGYYFTIQTLSFIAAILGVVIAIRKYNYDLKNFLKYFKFSLEMFTKTKALAFSSLLTTIAWILYFELDSLILSKFYGLKIVAIYGIGFTFLSFTRTLYNTIYSPFLSRFNHFIGNSDDIGLYKTYSFLIKFTFPLCIIPPVVLVYYMSEIITTWVGHDFIASIFITQMFIGTMAMTAISLPSSYLLLAKEKTYFLNRIAIFLPIIFYLSLFSLNLYIGYKSLAISKFITLFVGVVMNFYFTLLLLGKKILDLYMGTIKNLILPLLSMFFLFWLLPNHDIQPKTLDAYLSLAYHIIPTIIIPLIFYYCLDNQTRLFILSHLSKFYIKKTISIYQNPLNND